MTLTPRPNTVPPPPPSRERDHLDADRGRIAWRPSPEWRLLVEILTMGGFSQQAIIREMKQRNLPCGDEETLTRHFAEELAHGKERRLAGYVTKIHTIAMGETPQALRALMYLMGVHGGARWRVNNGGDAADEIDQTAAGVAPGEQVVFYIPENGRDGPREPATIEGEAEDAA
jgi:hypothetical protein